MATTVQRSDVTFPSEGEACAAWLYRPAGDGPRPLVVLAHGWAGTRDARLDAYAERFAAAGLGALAFDYRHFGDSTGEPRQLLDIDRQQADYAAAVAYARALEWVDADRVAVWGTSFSGGHVWEVAAADARIAAVVSQVPFIDGLANVPSLGVRGGLRLTARGVSDEIARRRGRPPVTVPAVGPPGSVAVMTTPDAEPGYRALFPPGSDWRNETAARVMLKVGTYRPGRVAPRVHCPVLVCVCDRDVVTPPKPAIRAADRAPHAELRRYPLEHFEIYVGEGFARAVADQTEFLVRHLLPA